MEIAMLNELLEMLVCPACNSNRLELHSFKSSSAGTVQDGVIKCIACNAWYPIEDELLEFLTGDLAYKDDRTKFWARYADQLRPLGLSSDDAPQYTQEQHLQTVQQKHFDWYAKNDQQTYSAYERRPFWMAVDQLTYADWRQ